MTLEKWQGSSVVPYTWQEDAWVESARQIKAIDPTAKVSCDLGAHIVEVERYLSERAISEAIRDVGYDVKAPAAT